MINTQSQSLLTSAQIDSYWTDGFIVIDDLFSPDEVEQYREAEGSSEIQSELNRRGIEEKIVHLLEITRFHPAFLELARSRKIVDRITPLLGPDIQLQHSKLATKPTKPGAGAFGWHQDYPYYPHTNTSLLSVFVYLDDATPENGCMSMVRGSHKLGPLNHSDKEGYFSGVCQETEHWREKSNVVEVTPKAGSISIHHCLTLHGSPPNLSGRPRRGLVFSYRADDAYQLGDTIFEDTGLLVCGQRRGQVRHDRLTVPLPRRRANGHPSFGSACHQTGEWAEKTNLMEQP